MSESRDLKDTTPTPKPLSRISVPLAYFFNFGGRQMFANLTGCSKGLHNFFKQHLENFEQQYELKQVEPTPDQTILEPGETRVNLDRDQIAIISLYNPIIKIMQRSKPSQCIKELKGHEKNVLFAHYLEQTNQLLTGSDDGTIKLWDLRAGTCVRSLPYSEKTLEDSNLFSYTFCFPYLFVCEQRHQKHQQQWALHNITTGECLRKVNVNNVTGAKFLPHKDPKQAKLAIGYRKDTQVMLDVVFVHQDKSCLARPFVLQDETPGYRSFTNLTLLPNGELAGESFGQIYLWDLRQGTQRTVSEMKVSSGRLDGIAVISRNRILVLQDNLTLIDTEAGKTIRGWHSVANRYPPRPFTRYFYFCILPWGDVVITHTSGRIRGYAE